MKKLIIFAVSITFLMAPGLSTAAADEVPPIYPVQGFLTDAEGDPVDGNADIRFRLYDTADEVVHQEIVEVSVSNGSFLHYLGLEEPLDADLFRRERELEMGIKVGTDDEMTPRLSVGTVPFAAYAQAAGEANFAFQAGVADEVSGSMTIYRVTNLFCEESPGTLSFTGTCPAGQANVNQCPECDAFNTIRARNCSGNCTCVSTPVCLSIPCDPRAHVPRCDNTEVGQIVPLPGPEPASDDD